MEYEVLVQEFEELTHELEELKSQPDSNPIKIAELENQLGEITDKAHSITFRKYMNLPE